MFQEDSHPMANHDITALIKQESSKDIMGEDSNDVFFSLEDDEPQASGEKTLAPSSNQILEDVVVLDAEIVEQATGCYKVEWPLVGMDCPDCAGKAMTALRILPQVNAPAVSATRGDVKLELDLEKGSLSEVSSALRSLGHLSLIHI